MKDTFLWLDDMRDPNSGDYLLVYSHHAFPEVHWVKSYQEFIDWITENGLPYQISFDHDLGGKRDGYDCAKWLLNYCDMYKEKLPLYNVHSSNLVGKENIESLLENFKKWKNS